MSTVTTSCSGRAMSVCRDSAKDFAICNAPAAAKAPLQGKQPSLAGSAMQFLLGRASKRKGLRASFGCQHRVAAEEQGIDQSTSVARAASLDLSMLERTRLCKARAGDSILKAATKQSSVASQAQQVCFLPGL